ncbi:MAG TPA: hypothetical protein VG826_26835 [Pirellulales bacterium]|nr:hypothetical protein [Pirellulales bacterium]
MPRHPASLLLSVSVLLATFAGPFAAVGDETAMSADQALELARKTGRPIFAVAGSPT